MAVAYVDVKKGGFDRLAEELAGYLERGEPVVALLSYGFAPIGSLVLAPEEGGVSGRLVAAGAGVPLVEALLARGCRPDTCRVEPSPVEVTVELPNGRFARAVVAAQPDEEMGVIVPVAEAEFRLGGPGELREVLPVLLGRVLGELRGLARVTYKVVPVTETTREHEAAAATAAAAAAETA